MKTDEFIRFYQEKYAQNPNCVIAIDGRCASGKTTLSKQLTEMFDVEVIHMDDFFLPKELRTSERLSEIGGNLHYERFLEEVKKGILSKKSFYYQKFDCKTMSFTSNIEISNTKPIIIEGAYCLREEFRDIYSLKVFMTIDKELQKERIIKRNGLDGYENFKNLWIPKEENYISHFSIKEISDLSLQNY